MRVLRSVKKNYREPFSDSLFVGGKEGIRTPEALLTLTRFPGGPLQPLEHLSVWVENGCKSTNFFRYDKKNVFLHHRIKKKKQ